MLLVYEWLTCSQKLFCDVTVTLTLDNQNQSVCH